MIEDSKQKEEQVIGNQKVILIYSSLEERNEQTEFAESIKDRLNALEETTSIYQRVGDDEFIVSSENFKRALEEAGLAKGISIKIVPRPPQLFVGDKYIARATRFGDRDAKEWKVYIQSREKELSKYLNLTLNGYKKLNLIDLTSDHEKLEEELKPITNLEYIIKDEEGEIKLKCEKCPAYIEMMKHYFINCEVPKRVIVVGQLNDSNLIQRSFLEFIEPPNDRPYTDEYIQGGVKYFGPYPETESESLKETVERLKKEESESVVVEWSFGNCIIRDCLKYAVKSAHDNILYGED